MLDDDTDWLEHFNELDKMQQNLCNVLHYGDHVRLDPEWHLYEVFKRQWLGCDEATYYGFDDDQTLNLLVEPIIRPGVEEIWAGSLMYHDGLDWKPIYPVLGFKD